MNKNSGLRKVPLLRLLVIFIIGILLTDKYNDFFINRIPVAVFIIFLFLVIQLVLHYFKRGVKLHDFLIPVTVFAISILITSLVFLPLKFSGNSTNYFSGIIYDSPQLKTKSILIPIEIRNEYSPLAASGIRVNLYTTRDSALLSKLYIGDRIIFRGKLNRIKNFGNPGEFDFEKYMLSKLVFYQAWIPENQFLKLTDNASGLFLSRFADKTRQKVFVVFERYIKNKDALALTTAMTIGDRDLISDEVMQSYAVSGVLHILSVSGLHVGIIFLFLNFLLKRLDGSAKLSILKVVFIISVVWLYALISGLSPSVNRSSLMFSLISVGQLFRRDISFFNILAGSALIMLLINPLQLFDVGFQLSYLAIAGIALFQPYLYSLLSIENYFADLVYKMLTVSFAAQLATFPLSIFYFNQFPVYFWLANMLVIPLVFVILILAILLLSVSFLSPLALFLGFLSSVLGSFLNTWVAFIENLPGSSIQNLSITRAEVILIFGLIASVFVWLSKRKARAFIVSLFVLNVLFLLNIGIRNSYRDRETITVYNSRQGLNIGLYSEISRNLYTTVSDSISLKQIKRMATRHLMSLKLKPELKIIPLDSLDESSSEVHNFCYKNLLLERNQKPLCCIARNKDFYTQLAGRLSCNYLLVAANLKPPDIAIPVKEIIICSGTSASNLNLWKEYAMRNMLAIHVLNQSGACTFNATDIK